MEIVLSAISVGATCTAAILSYLSFRSTETAQRQNVNTKLLGKREKAFSFLKTWCNKANTTFKGYKGGQFDRVLVFRTELLSGLKNQALKLYSEELAKYDHLQMNSKDTKLNGEIRNKQREIYRNKWEYILVSTRKAQRKINSAKHIFSLSDEDISKIELFTEVYYSVVEKIINCELGDDELIKQEIEKINSGFDALNAAHKELSNAKILENMSDQLNELRDLFGG